MCASRYTFVDKQCRSKFGSRTRFSLPPAFAGAASRLQMALSVGVTETSEVVWKGEEAFVLQGLDRVGGKKFVRLTKDKYSVLNQLLVPSSQRKSLFPKTRLFEEITALRNARVNALVSELLAAGRGESDDDAASGHDPTALLGLDAPGRQPRAQPRGERRRKEHAARAQLPATATVSYTPPGGGEPWDFDVVLTAGVEGKKNAAIELTSGNLDRLRGLLASEIAALASARSSPASAPKAGAGAARKPAQQPDTPGKKLPKGAKGDREYFIASKNKWVRKCLVQGGKDGVRKYRVLTRNPTSPQMPAAVPAPEPQQRASGGGGESGSGDDPADALGL